MNCMAPADIVQQLSQLSPQAELFDLPRVPIEVPDAAVFENGIEEHLSELDPTSRAAKLVQVTKESVGLSRLDDIPNVRPAAMGIHLQARGHFKWGEIRFDGEHASRA